MIEKEKILIMLNSALHKLVKTEERYENNGYNSNIPKGEARLIKGLCNIVHASIAAIDFIEKRENQK